MKCDIMRRVKNDRYRQVECPTGLVAWIELDREEGRIDRLHDE